MGTKSNSKHIYVIIYQYVTAKTAWELRFRTLRLGFEGTSREIQMASSHKVSNHDLESALDCLRKVNGNMIRSTGNKDSAWDIGVYVIMGLSGQTVGVVIEAMEFVNKSGAKIKLAEYSPVPCTEEFQKASKLYPQIKHEPLSHNKSAFATHGMGIDYKTFDEMKSMAKRLNAQLAHVNSPV